MNACRGQWSVEEVFRRSKDLPAVLPGITAVFVSTGVVIMSTVWKHDGDQEMRRLVEFVDRGCFAGETVAAALGTPSRRSSFALCALFFASACGAPPSPSKGPVYAAPAVSPTRRGLSACTRESLAAFTPSAVGVVSRRALTDTIRRTSRRVKAEDVACNGAPIIECLDWSNAHAKRVAATSSPALTAVTSLGIDELGTRVVLVVDGAKRTAENFRTRAALIAAIHALEVEGHKVKIVSESRGFENRGSRVEILYREAEDRAQPIPTAELVVDVPLAPRALWESYFLLDDELRQADIVNAGLEPLLARLVLDLESDASFDASFKDKKALGPVFLVYALMLRIPDRNAQREGPQNQRLTLELRCRE